MNEVIERLLAVQERDSRIVELTAQLSAIPGEKAAWDKQIQAAANRLEKAKTRLREIEVEKKSLEVEVESKQQQIRKYQTQQLETRKNEEYTALGHEIDAANKHIVGLEDRELELMEEAESLNPQIREAEEAYAADKTRINKAVAALEQSIPNLKGRISELETERAKHVEGVDEDVLDLYERLFKSKGSTAIVALEHDVCMGCHMKVTNQTSVEVKSSQAIVHCPNCGRLLYQG